MSYDDEIEEFGVPVTAEAPAAAPQRRPFDVFDGGRADEPAKRGRGRPKTKKGQAVEWTYAQTLLNDGARYGDGQFFRWVGTHWQGRGEDEAEHDALQWLGEVLPGEATAAKARNCVATAKIHLSGTAPMPHPPADITEITNPNEVLIPLLDGTLLITADGMILREHDPADYLRYCLPFQFNPDAQAPRWHSFLQQVVPDTAVRETLRQYIGYTLMPDTRFQVFLAMYGGGSNGKGVITGTIKRLHDPAQVVAMKLDRLEDFALEPLLHAQLAIVDEVPSRINETAAKSLISGDTVSINRKYRQPLTFSPHAKWLVSTNQIPAVRDNSDGFWRRALIMPMPVRIAREDRDPLLQARLADELPGILLWALGGLRAILKRGGIEVAEAIDTATNAAREQTNSVLAWWNLQNDQQSIEIVPADELADRRERLATKAEVYASYRRFCELAGNSPFADSKFWPALELIEEAAVAGGRRQQDGKYVRLSSIIFTDSDTAGWRS